ncbi:30S ribosomal protein S4 [Coprothermobacter platensis]|uniref:30S ribosomal protein S4 n=1 Tax=Coprothermobacter platensis TaxID=108819 RepID=UPI0003727773|nr:30S ribosomal protein S4 [Coprothermobacter platensis]
MKYTGPACRICRRSGVKLFLKGEKCLSPKCPMERRAFPPGQHGPTRRGRRDTEYGIRLKEKQKLRHTYMITETQLRRYFSYAISQKGVATGTALLQLLERRLDAVVQRMGFASSIKMARNWVRQGHVIVNGKKVDIPSYLVKPGDRIALDADLKNNPDVEKSLANNESRPNMEWLSVDAENLEGTFLRVPSREEIPVAVTEQLIVEYYSR